MLRIEFNHGGVGISGIIGGFLEFSNILHDMIYVYHVITFDIYSLQTRFQIPNVLIHSPITSGWYMGVYYSLIGNGVVVVLIQRIRYAKIGFNLPSLVEH